MAASARLRWASEQIGAGSCERLREVGCGQGVVVGRVAATLSTGPVTGLDRSAKMIEVARRANAAHVEAGRAGFVVGSIEDVSLTPSSFDTVLAVRVAAFWTRADAVLPVVRRLLAPDGRLLLMFDAPTPECPARILDLVKPALAAHSFDVDAVRHGHGTAVIARPVD